MPSPKDTAQIRGILTTARDPLDELWLVHEKGLAEERKGPRRIGGSEVLWKEYILSVQGLVGFEAYEGGAFQDLL